REGWLGDLFEPSPINKISFINYPRSKTGIERRIPLWDITKIRMERYIKAHPPDESGLIFTTKQGLPMIRHSSNGAKTDSTVQSFNRLRKRAGVEQAGFYWLRHTFQTVAEDIKDLPAIAAVMGHADSTMAAQYREEVRPERIIEVVKYVSKWNTAGNGFEESL
ncbi:site-specific integrase, partial [Planctomicrobium sp.]